MATDEEKGDYFEPMHPVPDSLKLWFEHLSERKNHFDDRFWNTIKYYTSLIFTLSTVSIAVISLIYTLIDMYAIEQNMRFFSIVVVVIPTLQLILTVTAYFTIKSTYRLLTDSIAMLAISENLLGLHKVVKKKDRVFVDEKFLMPEKWVSRKTTFEENLKTMIDSDNAGSIWKLIKYQYYLFIVISTLLFTLSIWVWYQWYFVLP